MTPDPCPTTRPSWLRLHWTLMKPEIILLLQVAALGALVVHDLTAEGRGWRDTLATGSVVLLGGTLAAGGANALNMWYERDLDQAMARTRRRPLPQGVLTPRHALLFGLAASMAGVAVIARFANGLAGFWTGFSVLFYVGIYTIWLKRLTPQNIVIGGVAGATPPLVGWAAAAGGSPLAPWELGSPLPWLMFALICLWTPPHFWSLALFRSRDYARAGVPMLPVVKGDATTRRWVLGYSLTLPAVTALMWWWGGLGWLFLAAATVLGLVFIWLAWRLFQQESVPAARRLFGYSIIYLMVLFAAAVGDAVLGLY